MYLISAEEYKNTGVHVLIIKETDKIWVSMKNVHNGLGVTNIFDLILKEIYGLYKTKNLTKKQIRKYKMTEREIFEKYDNLSEDELSEKSNKNAYVKNDVMSTVIKRCRGEKYKRQRKIDGFRKKLMIPEFKL